MSEKDQLIMQLLLMEKDEPRISVISDMAHVASMLEKSNGQEAAERAAAHFEGFRYEEVAETITSSWNRAHALYVAGKRTLGNEVAGAAKFLKRYVLPTLTPPPIICYENGRGRYKY